MESRTTPTPVVLAYMDSMIGMFRTGGFSLDLTHHALHAMGSRMFGFTQELFNDTSDADPEMDAEMFGAMAGTYPYIFEIFTTISHDDASIVGPGCDDQFEFEFALDLMLDGLEKLKHRTARLIPSSGDYRRLTGRRLSCGSRTKCSATVAR